MIRARYSLSAGPPLITMPRDVDATVAAWRERRDASRASHGPNPLHRRRGGTGGIVAADEAEGES